MADTPTIKSKIEFFKPSHATGTWADWELQTGSNPTLSRQRSQTLKENGDELQSVQYGAQIAHTENFKAKRVTGAAYTIPLAGEIKEGAHVDSVEVSYTQTEAPTMNVSSHRHATVEGVAQAHDLCRVYENTVQLPARAIGVPSVLKFKASGGTEKNVFTLPAGIGMRSIGYTLAATHVDEADGDGNHLAGQNHDGVETLNIEFTGKVVIDELAIDAEWKLPDNDADGQSNTGATTKSITLTKHVGYSTTKTPTGGDK